MPALDPIVTEIVRNQIIAATEVMAETLVRTAYSPLLYDVRDFAATILSPSGDMWGETAGVIVFSQAFPEAVKAGIRRWQGQFADGDVLIVNDPFETGTHISDTNIYVPVFFDGELVCFCGMAAHWADIGGKSAGGWCPDTTDMFQEGLCFRHQKLVAGGIRNEALWDLIADNVRVPLIVKGDLEAKIAACKQGADSMRACCAKYGRDTVKASMEHVIRETDRSMRAAIAKLPEGDYAASLGLDSDGISEGGDYRIHLKVSVRGERVLFSLEGSSPTAHGPINLPEPCTRGILASGLKGLLLPFDAANAGHTQSLEFNVPRGSLVAPERPAPTDSYGYAVELLMELMFRCFSRLTPQTCPAGGYQLTAIFLSRTQGKSGAPFVMTEPVHGGNGAQVNRDGPTNQLVGNGDLPVGPVEVFENRYPIHVERLEFAPEMAGRGKFRGGYGVRKDYRVLEADCFAGLVIENTVDLTAAGVAGGGSGKPGYFVINPGAANEQRHTKRMASIGPLGVGTVVRVVTGGGGGWGDPLERDPLQVLHDVRNGFLNIDEARNSYGVVLLRHKDAWKVDETETRRLRGASQRQPAERVANS